MVACVDRLGRYRPSDVGLAGVGVLIWVSRSRLRSRVAVAVAAALGFATIYVAAKARLAQLIDAMGVFTTFTLGRDLIDQINNIGAFGLGAGAAGLAAQVLTRLLSKADVRDDNLNTLASALRQRALSRTRNHPLRRKLNRPLPLRVWFTRRDRAGHIGPAISPTPHGHIDQIVDTLREMPLRQLVVIGAPGAGKSTVALLLTHRMLAQPMPGEAMPILVSISSWNPENESVGEFIARRIEQDYGIIGTQAHRLVGEPRLDDAGGDGFWLMPVLDGLDELPAALHAKAIEAVDQFAAADNPFVLTSRTTEYRRAVSRAGVLSRAATVMLEQTNIDDAIDFLTGPQGAASRWANVLGSVRDNPRHPLSRVLSTPLMVSIARDVYSDHDSDPAELLEAHTARQISSRLFGQYITGVYSARPGRQRTLGCDLRIYDPQDALRWLGTLAHHLYERGTRDLHWWRIPMGLLSRRPTLVKACWAAAVAGVAGLAAAMPQASSGKPGGAAIAGAAAAGLTLLTAAGVFDRIFPHAFMDEEAPASRYRHTRWNAVSVLQKQVAASGAYRFVLRPFWGACCGLIVGCTTGSPLAAVLSGAAAAAAVGLIPAPRLPSSGVDPSAALRSCHRFAGLTAARQALAAAVSYTIVGTVLQTQPIAPLIAAAIVVHGAAAALAAGTWTWLRFRIAVVRLALHGFPRRHHGLLPVALVRFLRDGTHELRATMRHNGIAWQFRHALIQDFIYDEFFYATQRRLAHAGDIVAQSRLIWFHFERGDLAELQRLAATGNAEAAVRLSDMWREQGRLDEAVGLLRPLHQADPGDRDIAEALVQALREHGDIDGALTVLWHMAGDTYGHGARDYLADLLCELGRIDELRKLADEGEGSRRASEYLAAVLRRSGHIEELWARANDGNSDAVRELASHMHEIGALADEEELLSRSQGFDRALANLLHAQGRLDEAIAIMRHAVDHEHEMFFTDLLATLLRERGNVDELRARAMECDIDALDELENWLREQGRDTSEIEGILHSIVERQDMAYHHASACERLIQWWRENDRLDEIRELASTGNIMALEQLAQLLREGRIGPEEIVHMLSDTPREDTARNLVLAEAICAQGNFAQAKSVLDRAQLSLGFLDRGLYADILYQLEDLAELRKRAYDGDTAASEALTRALIEQGDVEEAIAVLRRSRYTVAGQHTNEQLAEMLGEAGYIDELHGLARVGWWAACREYAQLLDERGELVDANLASYHRRAINGDVHAAIQLAFLLRQLGRRDEAIATLLSPFMLEDLARDAYRFLADERAHVAAAGSALPRQNNQLPKGFEGLHDFFGADRHRARLAPTQLGRQDDRAANR